MTGSGSNTLLPRRKRRRRSNWRGPLYIAPAMALVIVFFVMPVLFTGWMSLHNWPLMGASRWIGFNNYFRMFNDTRFMAALNFTAYYTVIVTIAIFAGAFPLAIFVEKERQFVSAYRTIIFLPVVVGLATARDDNCADRHTRKQRDCPHQTPMATTSNEETRRTHDNYDGSG